MTMESLYRKQGRGVVAADERSRLHFPEIEQERGLIEFWLELVSYRLSMRTLVLSSYLRFFIVYILSIKKSTPIDHNSALPS
jgi:hypothetical protein